MQCIPTTGVVGATIETTVLTITQDKFAATTWAASLRNRQIATPLILPNVLNMLLSRNVICRPSRQKSIVDFPDFSF